MCLSLQNTSSVGVYDVVKDNSPGQMTMEEPLPSKGNTHHYMHSLWSYVDLTSYTGYTVQQATSDTDPGIIFMWNNNTC